MSIKSNLTSILSSLPSQVKVVVVSKNHTPAEMMEVYRTGHRIFGENRVQELVRKYSLMPQDIEWHFIGHLQTNKVRLLIPLVSMVHSVDSLKLLGEIDREARKADRIIPCLLQFHIATEETKYGLDIGEAQSLLSSREFGEMKHVIVAGVMGMATLTGDLELVRQEFRTLRNYFEQLRSRFFAGSESFREISMGMSGDYSIAVEEGSTMIRIGTIVFKTEIAL